MPKNGSSDHDRNAADQRWQSAYEENLPGDAQRENRSGIPIKPLYTPDDWDSESYMPDLGFPGEEPWTRGIYPTMHRGRAWSQRQLVGLATPEQYNARMRKIVAAGANALSVIPCNSVYRGYDMDEVDPVLLGTCGTTINTVDDLDTCLDGVPIDTTSIALNDPSPFTLLAFLLATANRRGISWDKVSGTSNQSDFISHFVANHMFFRLALSGARRVFVDHVAFANEHVPKWNPVSVVGQHMQQAGATPAEAMAFTLSTAIQFADDCIARGMDPDKFLPRFTFFFDISISFFEEIAKLRAGRRIWARIARDRLGAKDMHSHRFKFHAQTSGLDLTRQQPLNNIARVTAQAIAGIFGGLQSMHTDAYDEVLSTPTEEAAKIAVATQNILRDEAHLDDVIDPLAGSFYVETLTNDMEEQILAVMDKVEAAGGMFEAVRTGLVQRMIGESAAKFQAKVDGGEQAIVGVNKYQDDSEIPPRALDRPSADVMQRHIDNLKRFKSERSNEAVAKALDNLARASEDESDNIFGRIVEAVEAGATNGEVCGRLRDELGFGQPLIAA
ncbi:MAG: methylmalonyl-CoA mutase [Rhodospirillaceae bacterium]|nr:methylmalonyl-CoA mutase [Rhodospirillaceae bacterium]MBT3909085.1 methylmalonyl-CoA mutase [Rhodospirillaceae bacterium]MBT5297845.1 methylmalonyl-CoA mutase [Rhodospirillaceae bacterium]MBT5515606.1 methylmalonyl-CoA mutase [Rhodospirillaceae bacterium]MBT6084734.1 methylmalonyl-CoA mutase [Rhodospirillaceae bacterium]